MDEVSKRSTYITTSWDDGHLLDLGVVELLAKYELRGAFYIPKVSSRSSMTENEIRRLSEYADVGAQTMHHVDLTAVELGVAHQEIVDSNRWLEDVIGRECSMFCFPMGRYRKSLLRVVKSAGFVGARTVELLCLDYPTHTLGSRCNGLGCAS